MKHKKKSVNKQSSVKKQAKEDIANTQSLNFEHQLLIDWYKTVKFKKKMIGGVDEEYLWKRLEELNKLYEQSLIAERARYDALITQYQKACNAKVQKYIQDLYEGR